MSSPRSALVWKVTAAVSLAANAALVAWLVTSNPPPPAPMAKPAPKNATVPRDLQPYAALGSFLAENNRIPDLKWTAAQFGAFEAGVRGTYEGRGFPMDDDATRLRDDINRRVQAMMEGQQPDPVADYFRTLREKENVKQTPSGLHYRITEQGRGAPPADDATVVLSFTAQLPGGQKLAGFEQSRATVRLADLLPGLREGVRLLSVGGKALVYVPPSLSFSEKNWPASVPRGAPIVFFVELHDVR